MSKRTPEELKQIRINNLKKGGRVGKGRPKGSKNKITKSKIEKLLMQLLEDEKKPNRDDEINKIIEKETTLNLNIEKDESNGSPELEIEKEIKVESIEKEISPNTETTNNQQKEKNKNEDEKPKEFSWLSY
tara:strand:- start:150 stop:542 length:393 start_codon:yes stop_codon:yes gene_type:complete